MKKSIIFFVLLFAIKSIGQTTTFNEKDYAHKPVWIYMIKDTASNYFEVEKAYKIYFSKHEKPKSEQDVIGERASLKKFPSKRELKKLQQENSMRIEVKKYEHWHDMMLPYVQQDGHILTPSERLKIWSSQKQQH